ncbi:unnamed protein product [Boreogadus saida]
MFHAKEMVAVDTCVTQFIDRGTGRARGAVARQPSVAAQLDTQLQSNQKLKIEMLLKQLSSLRFLAGQGIPIDGNEPENSNLYKLMQLRSEDCPSISSDKNGGVLCWLT